MPLSVQCPHCGRRFEAADTLAGQPVKCACGQVVQVGAASAPVDFFAEELGARDNPLLAETPAEWAKATGAPPEIAAQIEKRMAKKLTSNSSFMMAVTGGVIALMLIIGLLAFWLGSH